MMQIKDMKNKVKIIIEYSKGRDMLGFDILSRVDLEKLLIKVFLRNGEVILNDEINSISICKK